MTAHEPESANRWATEHYGFDEDAADQDGRAVDAAAPNHVQRVGCAQRGAGGRHRRHRRRIRRRSHGGHDGITHVDRAGDHRGRGGNR